MLIPIPGGLATAGGFPVFVPAPSPPPPLGFVPLVPEPSPPLTGVTQRRADTNFRWCCAIVSRRHDGRHGLPVPLHEAAHGVHEPIDIAFRLGEAPEDDVFHRFPQHIGAVFC